MWVYGLDWAGPGQGWVAEACECGNETSVSLKCGEFLDQLQTCQLLKKDCTLEQVNKPVPVTARSKAWVCGRSPAEIVGLKPTGDMDVCLL